MLVSRPGAEVIALVAAVALILTAVLVRSGTVVALNVVLARGGLVVGASRYAAVAIVAALALAAVIGNDADSLVTFAFRLTVLATVAIAISLLGPTKIGRWAQKRYRRTIEELDRLARDFVFERTATIAAIAAVAAMIVRGFSYSNRMVKGSQFSPTSPRWRLRAPLPWSAADCGRSSSGASISADRLSGWNRFRCLHCEQRHPDAPARLDVADRSHRIQSFLSSSVDGWLSAGLGTPNPHPTAYLIAWPIVAAMWLVGPLGALVLLGLRLATHACGAWRPHRPIGRRAPRRGRHRTLRAFQSLGVQRGRCGASRHGARVRRPDRIIQRDAAGAECIDSAAGALDRADRGAIAILHSRNACAPRLCRDDTQVDCRRSCGVIVALPSVSACRGARNAFAHTVWRRVADESIGSAVGAAFIRRILSRLRRPARSCRRDRRVGRARAGIAGIRLPRAATRAVIWSFTAAVIVYVIALGVHGPLALPYTWLVRNVPESGVFRELYDLAGVFAAFALVARKRGVGAHAACGYAALAAGVALPLTWPLRPPSDLWVSSTHIRTRTIHRTPFTRVALTSGVSAVALRTGQWRRRGPRRPSVYPGSLPRSTSTFRCIPSTWRSRATNALATTMRCVRWASSRSSTGPG